MGNGPCGDLGSRTSHNLHFSPVPETSSTKFSLNLQPLAIMPVELNSDSKYDDYDYPTTSPNVQSGHPGHTTPQQDAHVFQLRTQLKQAGYSERLDTLSMVNDVLQQLT